MVDMQNVLASIFEKQQTETADAVLLRNLRSVSALVFVVMSTTKDEDVLSMAAHLRTRAELEYSRQNPTQETIDACTSFVAAHMPKYVWEANGFTQNYAVDWDVAADEFTLEATRMTYLLGLLNALPAILGDILELRGIVPIICCIIGAEMHRRNPEFADSFLKMGTRFHPEGCVTAEEEFIDETLMNPIVVSFVENLLERIPARATEMV